MEIGSEGWLIYSLSAIMRKVTDWELAPLGLSVSQMQVLVVLRDAGQPITISEIARQLFVATPSVTSMIDRLGDSGLVKRINDPKDRRKTLVALTENGKRLLESVSEPYRRLHEEMFGVLSGGEHEKLMAMLERLQDANLHRLAQKVG